MGQAVNYFMMQKYVEATLSEQVLPSETEWNREPLERRETNGKTPAVLHVSSVSGGVWCLFAWASVFDSGSSHFSISVPFHAMFQLS